MATEVEMSPIDFITTRRSVLAANLTGPGPSDAEIDKIIEAGLRVPDHSRCGPWRIQIVREAGQRAIGELCAALFAEETDDATDEQIEYWRNRPQSAPLLLVVSCYPNEEKIHKVPLIEQQADMIEARTGLRLEVVRVAVRNMSRDRGLTFADGVLTRDAHAVVADPEVDLVVEVIGGIEPARELIMEALAAGKPVITGNKELLANVGAELFAAADANGVDLLFEAAVAGGIPLIRPLRESLGGEPVTRVMGILNGTTNFILTKMSEEGAEYGEALAEAQELGYAERDPTADVEGFDAGAKAAIIASIAFGAKVVAGDVYHEGISGITAADIAVA